MKTVNFKKTLLAATLLFASVFLYFYRVIINKAWLGEDFMGLNFPAKYYLLNNFKEGIINFWNPYLFGGTPIMADIQFAIFYPLNLILIPFAKPGLNYMYWLLEMQVIFHLFLGGIFMYLLMRYFKVSRTGSLVSGVIFALLPFFVAHLKHVLLIETSIWFPLVFLFFHRALHKSGLRNSILASLVFGVMFLAGHPQAIYYITLFLFSYFVYFLISENYFSFPLKIAPLLKKTLLAFFIFLFGFLIAAVELVPYLEFLPNTARAVPNNFSFASSFSLSPLQFVFISLLPHFFGGQNSEVAYWGEWNYWEMVCYLGVFILFLSFIAFNFLKTKFIRFLLYIAIASLFLSFGYYFFAYPIAYFLLPGLKSLRVPARFVFLYSFSLTIASGFGFDYLVESKNRGKIKLFFDEKKNLLKMLLLPFFSALIIISALSYFYPNIFFPIPRQTEIIKTIIKDFLFLFLLFLGLIILLLKYFQKIISGKVFKFLIIFFILLELFLFGFQFNNGPANPVDFFKKTPEIEYLNNQTNGSPRLITNKVIYPNTALIYKLRSTEGYSVLSSLARYNDFVQGDFWPHYGHHELLGLPNRSKLLGVCYALSADQKIPAEYEKVEGLSLYKIPMCPPQAFLVHNYAVEKNSDQILKIIDGQKFDPLKLIILEEDLKIILSNQYSSTSDKVEIKKYEPDYIEIESGSGSDGFLFLSENYYPGWEAYIDGKKTKIYRANYLFRAIPLAKGKHIIKFVYNPKIFKLGFLLSFFTIIIILLVWLYLSLKDCRKNNSDTFH